MEFLNSGLKTILILLQVGIQKFFDLPYLCNRIKYLVGDKVINKLSP